MITQSETYSSSPWRVSVPSPRSAVMMAVTPLSFSQRKSRRNSAAQDAVIRQAGKQRLDGIQHHAFGADGFDGVAQAQEQPFEIVFAGLLDLAAFDVDVIEGQLACASRAGRSKPSEATFCASSSGRLLKGDKDARLVVVHRAAHEELHRQQRFAAPRPAADQRRPAGRQAAVGNIIQSRDAGRALGQRRPLGIDTAASSDMLQSSYGALTGDMLMTPGEAWGQQTAFRGRRELL